ncbi:hypothetical protein AB0K25_05330 [Micromonospora sp. NPDC049257]|uniref:hypothetical protein n=1 Tax=Micromonospora sp. NPDC049257 TaxID=3155771 RepID=UPI0034221D9D
MTTRADIPDGDRPPGDDKPGRDACGMTPAEIVRRWLRLVTADAELSPYLIGVDRVRLAGHLTAGVTVALAGEPADGWGGLGLSEEQHRRIGDYLVGVCWAADLPDERIAQVRRAVAR